MRLRFLMCRPDRQARWPRARGANRHLLTLLAFIALASEAHALCDAATPCVTTPTNLGTFPGRNLLASNGCQCMLVVVGVATTVTTVEAFRWTQAGGMVSLGDLPGGAVQSTARGVNADGSVVIGDGTSASGTEAFRWTQAGGMVGLGDLPGGSFK